MTKNCWKLRCKLPTIKQLTYITNVTTVARTIPGGGFLFIEVAKIRTEQP